ncbi:AAA family ATPase [Massilia sp. TW-1]|uniref:AAA family ATPase n=1 Tax=Telluria antibiotica TaxID=2717319 RepID=A0ABX0PBN0_9BURK|nr:AAA family ATPase [Telluria antibiotica]NIA54755.1 AAA family ATPase [Telluria antibiotica]
MQLSKVRIRNFRSIEDLTLPLDHLTVVCGPNSCGKSNVMRAILLALQPSVGAADVAENITQWKTGPRTSIHIELIFSACIPALAALAEPDGTLRYVCKLYRGGTVSRQVGASTAQADFELLINNFQIVYVPPIRDLNAGGLEPFRKLLKEALLRTRGTGNVNGLRDQAEKLFRRKARPVLSNSTNGVSKLLGNSTMELDFAGMEMESLAEQISLKVKRVNVEVRLDAVGTGHQSTVIMDLYKQLGSTYEGSLLFIFEEPDNHLHPSTIRCVADDFEQLSLTHQVLLSTHSPYLLNHFEMGKLRRLGVKNDATTYFPLDGLLAKYSSKTLHYISETYGLKCIEPLLSNLVIVVEGATDRTVLSRLYELRKNITIDAADILIVSAEGKDRVAQFCEILHLMKIEWRAVFDWDSVFSSAVPHFIPMTVHAKGPIQAAAQAILSSLDTKKKRGKNAAKTLNALLIELNTAVALPGKFEDSAVEKLLISTALLSVAERTALKKGLQQRAVNTYRPLLKKANCWVWPEDLEAELLRNIDCENIVEAELIQLGVLTAPPQAANRRSTLDNKLHGMANEPEKLAAVVDKLEQDNAFSRSAMNICLNTLFP